MGGVLIALYRVLQLLPALNSTVISPEFVATKQFKAASALILNEDFGKYLFVM